MRKNSKVLDLSNATSIDNGIIFYSNRNNHYVAIATIDDDGNITAEWRKLNKNDMKKINGAFPYLRALLYVMFLMITFYFIDTFMFTFPLFLFCSDTLEILTLISKKDFCKFHAAELMIYNNPSCLSSKVCEQMYLIYYKNSYIG